LILVVQPPVQTFSNHKRKTKTKQTVSVDVPSMFILVEAGAGFSLTVSSASPFFLATNVIKLLTLRHGEAKIKIQQYHESIHESFTYICFGCMLVPAQ